MTDHEANEAAERSDQARAAEWEREHEIQQDESLALAMAKDVALLLGVDEANARGDVWQERAEALERGKLRSFYSALAGLYWSAAWDIKHTRPQTQSEAAA